MKEEIQLLKNAASEIKMLRNQNALMKARLDMFDAINAMLHTEVARRGEGHCPDLVWEIENHLQNLETVEKLNPKP